MQAQVEPCRPRTGTSGKLRVSAGRKRFGLWEFIRQVLQARPDVGIAFEN